MNDHDQTVDNVHDIVRDNHQLLRDWLVSAGETFRNQGMTQAALSHIHHNVRPLTEAEEVAAGFLIGVFIDVLSHADKYGSPHDATHRVMDNATTAYRAHHIGKINGMPAWAAAQVANAMGLIQHATKHT